MDAQAGSRTTKHVMFDAPKTNENDASFQEASVNQNVEEIRERCKTNTDKEARKEILRDEDRGCGRC